MSSIHILLDDCREARNNTVIIRDPRIAIQVIRRLLKFVGSIAVDNDMGYGFEFEGRELLKQIMQDCKNANHWPLIELVTSNPVAKTDMEKTLSQYGYKRNGFQYIH